MVSKSLAALPLLLLLLACPSHSDPSPPPPPPPLPTSALLTIQPIAQQTEVWCWAACAEMVFRHSQMPNVNPAGNYQCGVVAAYSVMLGGFGHPCNSNCFLCTASIGPITEMHRVVVGYGVVANQIGRPSRVLSAQVLTGPLTLAQLALELDQGRPVIAGVNFTSGFSLPGISQHAVLLVGYDARVAMPFVYVNDPFPYAILPLQPNPYLQAGGVEVQPGRYAIPYEDLIFSIRWNNTILQIH